MSGFPLAVIWVSLAGSLLASFLGIRASVKLTTWAGSPWLRLTLITSSLISFSYFVSYWWLLLHPDQVKEWSDVMRSVGMLSWIVGPWVVLPITLEHHIKQRAIYMRLKADELLGEVRSEIDDNNVD